MDTTVKHTCAVSAYTLKDSNEYIGCFVYLDGNAVSTFRYRTIPIDELADPDHYIAEFIEFVIQSLFACGVQPDTLSFRFLGWEG